MKNTNSQKKDVEVSKVNRVIMASPKIILIACAILSTIIIGFSLWRGVACFIGTIILLCVCLRNIPDRPPHVGLVEIWGARLPIVVSEGWHIFAPFPPFMYTVTMINVEKVNCDFTFEDIRCIANRSKEEKEKDSSRWAGGEVSVEISMTWFPDYKTKKSGYRLISFIDSGEHDQVNEIIKDLLEEDLRQMARDHTWEEVTFSADKIKKKLILKLTGQELSEQVAEEFNKNGLPDIADLGVKITRFNVGKVKEQGDLAKAAGLFAKEIQERRGETIELETVYQMLKKMKRLGVPLNEALDAIQTERGKAEKHVYAVRGAEGVAPIVAGLGALGEVLGKKSKGGEKREKKKEQR